MKQVFCVCLALLLALSLAACGQKVDTNLVGNLQDVEQHQTETDSKAFQPDYSPDQKNFLGNTTANLMQGAYVAKQGDWIYYFNCVKGIQKRNDVWLALLCMNGSSKPILSCGLYMSFSICAIYCTLSNPEKPRI